MTGVSIWHYLEKNNPKPRGFTHCYTEYLLVNHLSVYLKVSIYRWQGSLPVHWTYCVYFWGNVLNIWAWNNF